MPYRSTEETRRRAREYYYKKHPDAKRNGHYRKGPNQIETKEAEPKVLTVISIDDLTPVERSIFLGYVSKLLDKN